MKLFKNGTVLLIIGVIGLITVIGAELYWHHTSPQSPKSYTPQEIVQTSEFPVDINIADETALSAIPSLSKKQIKSIIDYRREHGGFTSVEELLNVKGVGKVTYESILPYVVVK